MVLEFGFVLKFEFEFEFEFEWDNDPINKESRNYTEKNGVVCFQRIYDANLQQSSQRNEFVI
jgi:hypothetical protein